MTDDVDQIEAGKAAWQRIRERSKSTFSDWLEIGRMLIAGRSLCMKRAACNSPYGPNYQRFMRQWLEENGLQGIDSHERRGSIVCVENLEIQAWRSKLSDVEQRRCNHPNSVLAHFRRKTRPVRSGPKTSHQDVAKHVAEVASAARQGKPIYWPQAAVRRSHEAMLASRSSDLLVLARLALEAAIRTEADLIALLDDRPPPAFRPKGSHAATLPHELA